MIHSRATISIRERYCEGVGVSKHIKNNTPSLQLVKLALSFYVFATSAAVVVVSQKRKTREYAPPRRTAPMEAVVSIPIELKRLYKTPPPTEIPI